MKRKNRNCGTCIFAAVLLFFGAACLCFLSYRFLLFIVAALFVVIGIVLIKRC